jgi:cardiolipin synthase (CMP-forming)
MGDRATDNIRSDVLTIPNVLSIFRILLVPVFLWSLLNRKPFEALLLFFIAGITDLLDGLAARVWHQRSKLGIVLDPAGDKLLMATSFVALTIPSLARPNTIPVWLTSTVILRDLLISGGALYAYLTWRQKAFLPTLLGKISTGCQVGMIFLVLFFNYRNGTPWIVPWIFGISMFWTLASGVHYFIEGLKILRDRRRQAPDRP